MSRNFELLQKLGKEQEILRSTPADSKQGAPAPVVPAAEAPAGTPAAALANDSLEQVNALAQQLFIIPGADTPRTVVFASTEPGTGCTWVCAHLAEVLASRVAGSVCLVDGNLRDPGLHQHFGVENAGGLSDALLRLDPIRTFARSVALPNLWLLSAGPGGESVQGLLTSDRMRLRLTELRAEFDFVLIDASAMSVANDVIALGSMSDGVVLVLKANASRRQVARQAIEDLQGGKAKVLGAVLNQRTFPIPDALYNKL
ncbi:MAG: CpsD/CapB family tyrosine-protein kinase [Acidobacteriia bacterium]|nr:CpsD/CapB family tyrosine-protein kinase [Terriglobia bacterium]